MASRRVGKALVSFEGRLPRSERYLIVLTKSDCQAYRVFSWSMGLLSTGTIKSGIRLE